MAGTGTVLGPTVTEELVPWQQAVRQAVLTAMDAGLLLPGTGAPADAAFCGTELNEFPGSLGLVPAIRMSPCHCRPRGSRGRRRPARERFPGPRARAGGPACYVPVRLKAERQHGWTRCKRFEGRLATGRAFPSVKRAFKPGIRSRKRGNIVRGASMKLADHSMLCAA